MKINIRNVIEKHIVLFCCLKSNVQTDVCILLKLSGQEAISAIRSDSQNLLQVSRCSDAAMDIHVVLNFQEMFSYGWVKCMLATWPGSQRDLQLEKVLELLNYSNKMLPSHLVQIIEVPL